ncbi:MAG: SAM-dependent chlorinase/fluorinase [Magnetococcales bacterium]|nr:SAM-dependent chlorinase/fluorinase [Magnetococcales bacterium]NGZ27357.1 SAM-dependent chlorinase/fluorinase [Magnetococcales bacterium]
MGLPIVLISDFGSTDPYIGQVKGVLLQRLGQVQWIDLYHDLPPFAISSGSFLIEKTFHYMPSSVWFCVVDPGVGTSRRMLVVQYRESWFVSPDNGLLTPILSCPGAKAWQLKVDSSWLVTSSNTFHGRDLFAPAVAQIVSGQVDTILGEELRDPVMLSEPFWWSTANGWKARVKLVDRYGNLITGLPGKVVEGPVVGWLKSKSCGVLSTTFGNLGVGEGGLVVGGFGTVEVVINQGSAAACYGCGVGEVVEFIRTPVSSSV